MSPSSILESSSLCWLRSKGEQAFKKRSEGVTVTPSTGGKENWGKHPFFAVAGGSSLAFGEPLFCTPALSGMGRQGVSCLFVGTARRPSVGQREALRLSLEYELFQGPPLGIFLAFLLDVRSSGLWGDEIPS